MRRVHRDEAFQHVSGTWWYTALQISVVTWGLHVASGHQRAVAMEPQVTDRLTLSNMVYLAMAMLEGMVVQHRYDSECSQHGTVNIEALLF